MSIPEWIEQWIQKADDELLSAAEEAPLEETVQSDIGTVIMRCIDYGWVKRVRDSHDPSA